MPFDPATSAYVRQGISDHVFDDVVHLLAVRQDRHEADPDEIFKPDVGVLGLTQNATAVMASNGVSSNIGFFREVLNVVVLLGDKMKQRTRRFFHTHS